MSKVDGKTVGITFYCLTPENFYTVAKLKLALDAAGISSEFSWKEYEGRKVIALDVYENANVVANYLPAN